MSLYTPLPADWTVVITDVQGSTKAILDGKYKDVNTLGAASIVAVLNAVKPLKIPYVFGGDGATLCIPPSVKEKVEAALAGTRAMAANGFGLTLRTGLVEMKTILEAGHQVLVGKFQPSAHYEQTMFAGEGLAFAETLVKGPDKENRYRREEKGSASTADFSGFECRWNEIPSPRGETVALMVKALTGNKNSTDAVYDEILQSIVAVYGKEELHHPLRPEKLSLTVSPQNLSVEARVKNTGASFGKRSFSMLRLFVHVMAGKLFLWLKVKNKSADWGKYKESLIANTDYRKFDGILRMIISGTADQRIHLRSLLDEQRAAGKIVFGLYANPSALITCLISNYDNNHVHFLDGSTGGYALAASELKKQLNCL